MKKGMGGHHSANMKTEVWLTPPEILQPLGQFDLDPCAADPRPFPTAKVHYTAADDGLTKDWFGDVWLNPPYGREIEKWMARMAEHNSGVSLIFARTETQFFQRYVFQTAASILFLDGRVRFLNAGGIRSTGNSGAPSVLIAYGEKNVERLGDSGLKGKHVLINVVPVMVVGVSPTWQAVVRICLVRLGKEAHLERIYEMAEMIAPDKVGGNRHYQEKIRQVLQSFFTNVKRGVYRVEEEVQK